jgi:hypothetical protein
MVSSLHSPLSCRTHTSQPNRHIELRPTWCGCGLQCLGDVVSQNFYEIVRNWYYRNTSSVNRLRIW